MKNTQQTEQYTGLLLVGICEYVSQVKINPTTIPHLLEPEVFLTQISVPAALVFHECTLDWNDGTLNCKEIKQCNLFVGQKQKQTKQNKKHVPLALCPLLIFSIFLIYQSSFWHVNNF